MANNLPQFRRTATTGLRPNTTNSANNAYIPAGSFAVNLTDKKVFSSDGSLPFEVGSNLSSINVGNSITVATKLNVGSAAGYDFGTTAVIEIDASQNTYVQSVIQNANSGTNASGDLVITADTGNDTVNFVDFGINSSTYSNASFTITGALDAYLYSSNTALVMGTASDKEVVLHAGGTLAANRKLTINSTAIVINNTPLFANSGNFTTLSTTGNLTINTTSIVVNSAANTTTYGAGVITGGTGNTLTLSITGGTGSLAVNSTQVIVGTLTLNTANIVSTGTVNSTTFAVNTAFTVNTTYLQTTGQVRIANSGISAPVWGANGVAIIQAPATFTDNTSATSATIPNAYMNYFAPLTYASANAITVTNLYGTFFAQPSNGTNVTSPGAPWAIGGDSINITGNVSFPIGGATSFTVGSSQVSGTMLMGGASGTGTITLGRSTANQTTNIQAGVTAAGSTKTIVIGTNGAAGSQTNITIGASAANSSLIVYANSTVFSGIVNASSFTVGTNFTANASTTVLSNSSISGFLANINTQTASYTLANTDSGRIVEIANSTAATTITLPATAPAGFNCTVVQVGTSNVTFSNSTGTTLFKRSAGANSGGQWAMSTVYVRTNVGGAAASWVLGGDTL